MADPTVTVRGDATVSAEPDEAAVTIRLSLTNKKADAALGDVARDSEKLNAILDELAVTTDARVTTGVSVAEEKEYDGKRWVQKGYRASNSIVLHLGDPQLVGRVLSRVTENMTAEIQGPWWKVAPANPARGRAYKEAAEDAKRKAEAIASALGAKLGPVIEVNEPGLRKTPEVVAAPVPAPAARMFSPQSTPAPPIEVHAGAIEVSAAVEATFSLKP